MKVKYFLIKNKLIISGIILGILSGYFYWLFVGCKSGTCPITSSWVNSSLWGGIMGGLLFSLFKKK